MTVRNVLAVFGTRPEAIKMAPIVLAMRNQPDLRPVVVVTGQHRAMLDQVLDLFDIKPDFDLNIGRDRQTLSDTVSRALTGLANLMFEKPDLVMVQGDTATTFAAALAAFFHRVPVVHVEAGLRTGDITSPYPEEMNRLLTTRLTALHLAATPSSVRNLLAEGVPPDSIVCTGNSVIDALLTTLETPMTREVTMLAELGRHRGPVLLVTTHRRESWGAPMAAVGRAIVRLAAAEPELLIVVPMHLNPVVRDVLRPMLAPIPNVMITDPLDYEVFCRVMQRSDVILTDSGGVQEEGPSLGKPVLVLRDTTERPEAVEAGTARLVGTDEDRVVESVLTLLRDPLEYEAMAKAVNPYGDGQAAERAVTAIRYYFGDGPRPAEFLPAMVSAEAGEPDFYNGSVLPEYV